MTPRIPQEARTDVMCALCLLAEQACTPHHQQVLAPGDYDLAVVARAWELAGYTTFDAVVHIPTQAAFTSRVYAALGRRNKAKLQARAEGLLQALVLLHGAGALPGHIMREQQRQLWLAAGGYELHRRAS